MTVAGRILVVDDDPASRALLNAILGVDYEVLAASDSETGLALFRERRPDLVITDIFLPGKDGVRLIEELRAAAPDTRIIAVSAGWRVAQLEIGPALRRDDVLEDALAAGANLALSKPLDPTVVMEAVTGLLHD